MSKWSAKAVTSTVTTVTAGSKIPLLTPTPGNEFITVENIVADTIFTTAFASTTTVSNHISNTGNPHSVTASQVGLGSVENTALSTWAGSANITTLGTISSGAVPASLVTAGTFGAGAYVFPSTLTVTTALTASGGSAVRGAFTPSSGIGLEFQGGASSYITAYNRDTPAYVPLLLRGSTLTLGVTNTATAISIATTGAVTFAGAVSGITTLGATSSVFGSGSGATASVSGNQVVADGTTNSGMSILSGTTGIGSLFFGDSGLSTIGAVRYNHSTNTIALEAGNAVVMSGTSTGATFGGTVATGALTVTGAMSATSSVSISGAADGFGYYYIKDAITGATSTDGVRIGFNAGVFRIQNYEATAFEFYTNNTVKWLSVSSAGASTFAGALSGITTLDATTTISAPRINGSTGTGTLLLYGDSAATIPLTISDTGAVSVVGADANYSLNVVTDADLGFQIRRNSAVTGTKAGIGARIFASSSATNHGELYWEQTNAPSSLDTKFVIKQRQSGSLATILEVSSAGAWNIQGGSFTTTGTLSAGNGTGANQFVVSGLGGSNGAVLKIVDANAVSLGMYAPSPTVMWYETDTVDQNYMARLSNGVLQFGTQNDAISSFTSKVTFDQSGNISTTGTLASGAFVASGMISTSTATGTASPTPSEMRIATTSNGSNWSLSDPWGRLSFYSADASGGGAKIHASITTVSRSATGTSSDLKFNLTNPSDSTLTSTLSLDYQGATVTGTLGLTGILTSTSTEILIDSSVASMFKADRGGSTYGNGLQLKTAGTNNWSIGQGQITTGSDFHIYNYGTASGALKIDYTTNVITTYAGVDIAGNTTVTGTLGVSSYLQGTTTNGYLDLRGDSGATSGVRIYDTGGATLTASSVADSTPAFWIHNSQNAANKWGLVVSTTNNGSDSEVFHVRTNNTTATNGTSLFSVIGDGNVVVGGAAIATTATNGFLYIPSCAGAPTGVPTTYTGRTPMVFDTTNNKLMIYDGGWIGVTLA